MTIIHQEIVVLSHITCDVWDCVNQSLTASATVQAPEDQLRRDMVAVGSATQESSRKLLDDARLRGWHIGPHHNLCPTHVLASVEEYMKAKAKQELEIAAQKDS